MITQLPPVATFHQLMKIQGKTDKKLSQIIPSRGEEKREQHRGKANRIPGVQQISILVINKPACAPKILNLMSQRNSTPLV